MHHLLSPFVVPSAKSALEGGLHTPTDSTTPAKSSAGGRKVQLTGYPCSVDRHARGPRGTRLQPAGISQVYRDDSRAWRSLRQIRLQPIARKASWMSSRRS